jgi:hypothetical protein
MLAALLSGFGGALRVVGEISGTLFAALLSGLRGALRVFGKISGAAAMFLILRAVSA